MGRLLLLLLCLCAGGLRAQEAPPGATTCSGCHGAGSALPLDGLTAEEIEAAMAVFREGSRTATLMPRLATGFSGEETAAIAAWIAAGRMHDDAR